MSRLPLGATMSDVPVLGRATALAETIGGSLEDRFLGAAGVRVRAGLEIRQVVLDELAIDGLAGVGPVIISGCRLGTLRLTDVAIREGVIIEDCDIGSLEIRGGRRTAFSLLRSGMRRCVLHECGTLVVDSTTVTELAAISDLQNCSNSPGLHSDRFACRLTDRPTSIPSASFQRRSVIAWT